VEGTGGVVAAAGRRRALAISKKERGEERGEEKKSKRNLS
jgi:hypothetical protein